ncbi:PD-(D/E)XK nuclease family protein [Natronococcus wangiae]|uniref:PD-(D/E)XK nuclease family protein n=1 Tax=Natronococcus wangiae TaxID=3068275 RepID=UPI00273EAA65|nr:PD-(D/E)XK nuclease family protein [Natronococcus sp. AD5]
MDGDRRVEESAYPPLEADGERVPVSIRGVVDLVHVSEDTVEIVDYKTERGRRAEAEYRTRQSVYYPALEEAYPDRTITASIGYTADGEREAAASLSRDERIELPCDRQRGNR